MAASTTRTVTFLFCDMVGSTDLLSREGLDVSEDARQRLFAALREAVTATGGEEVKSLGDGLMVAFPLSVADGVTCAVAMQRAVRRLNLERPAVPLAIRVGVSVGEATPSDGDWYGTPVNVAARLCAAAGAGEVYASAGVAAVLGLRAETARSVGALALKGIPDLHATVAIDTGVDTANAPAPLPTSLEVDDAWPLVGRDRELAELAVSWQAIQFGARAVTVVGEPGAGVTRLLRAFARACAADGALVLHASVGESDGAFDALADAVRWYVAVTAPEQLVADLGQLAPDLEGLLPGLRVRLAGVPRSVVPGSRSPGVAIERLIRSAASRRPVLLVLDGAHRLGPEALAVLASLAAAPEPVLVACGRQRGAAPEVPLVPGEVVELSGLDADGVACLLTRISGIDDDATLDAVMGATRGNARHVVDVARSLRAGASGESARTVIEHTCPYRGLVPFTDADHTLFFGRDDQVTAVLARLASRRWVTVVGASGSGKSSLVRAGVVPALRRGALPGSDAWHDVTVVPGDEPTGQLASALAALDDVDDGADAIAAALRADPDALDRVARHLAGDGRLVLVVDQLEELFVTTPTAERARFLDLLLRATASPGGPTTVVAVIRADFYGHLADVPGLAPALESGHLLVAPMAESDLSQAITQPAFVAGLRLETGLAETIVADVAGQPGALPLLSHALLETWRRREGRTLTLRGYREAGGVRGAIARTAEAVHDGLPETDRAMLRALFQRLVSPGDGAGDTRRRVARDELPSDVRELVPDLVAARLVTADGDTVEVAHEALIREWPRLRTWLDDDREALRVHRHLTQAAAAWVAGGADSQELYGGGRLAQVEEWVAVHRPVLNAAETSFVVASRARLRARVRRRRGLFSALAVLTVAAVTAASVAVVQQRRAESNARASSANARAAEASADAARDSATREADARADADLRRLAFQARTLAASQPDLGMLLAVEAYQRRTDVDSLGALQGALTAQPTVHRFVPLDVGPGQGSASIDAAGGLVAVGTTSPGSGKVVLLDAADLRATGVVLDVGGWATVAVRPDGGEVATATNAGPVLRWNPATGRASAPPIEATPWDGTGITRPLVYLNDGSLVVAQHDGIRRYPAGTASADAFVALDGDVTAMAFEPATSQLVVGYGSLFTRRYAVRVLDGATLAARGDELALQADAFAVEPGGRLVATNFPADFRSSVWRLDVASGTVVDGPRPLPSMPLDVVVRSDGRIVVALISGDLLPLAPDLTPLDERSTGLGIGGTLAVGADDRLLAVSAGRLVVLDPDARTTLGTPLVADGRPVAGTVALDRSGSRLLVVGPTGGQVRDATTLEPVGPTLAPTQAPLLGTMSLSPDGSRIGVSGLDRTEVLDAATGLPLWPAVPAGGIVPPSFSPDGRTAVTGGLDSVVRLLDVETGQQRWATDLGGFNVAVLPEWSPDATRIALFANGVGTVLLDATTGAAIGTPYDGTQLTFSPDGRHAALFGTGLAIIDLETGSVTSMPGNTGLFSAGYLDAATILGLSLNGTIALIDVATGRQIGNRVRVSGDILTQSPSFAFDRAARRLYVGRRDGGIVRYDLDVGRWARLACVAAGRELTTQEWDTYLSSLGPRRSTCATG